MVLLLQKVWRWFTTDFLGIAREMRLSYLPPLMVYLAAGVSSFTGIIESFFVKEQLGLSAAFLASLAFWAGLPWALKMPLGHLVDLFWRRKAFFVYLGALFMAASLVIMVGLTGHKEWMAGFMRPDFWYILSALLSPIGFVLQDVVADAMTVEAVHPYREDGSPVPEKELQRMHVTMQTLGRIAIIGGSALVAGVGGWLATVFSYETMYRLSLVIPVISITGALLGSWNVRRLRAEYRRAGLAEGEIRKLLKDEVGRLRPNWYILLGSAAFVLVSVTVGVSALPGKKEAIFMGSLITILYLMHLLLKDLPEEKRREILGIALIVFVFRAMPSIGAGVSWWQIDVLKFDEAFFGTLRQISAILAIIGMVALRGWMARRPIPYLVVFLSIYGTVMMMPFVGMYYGLHEWTERVFGFGARTIAIIDTMADSPMGQVSMVPMLAWIAREAPLEQKATYFAVMAAFTNLALSASSLATSYLNEIFVVERGAYQELGKLMITAVVIGFILPVATVLIVNRRNRPRSSVPSPVKKAGEVHEVVE
jgi:MFS family permease